MDFIWNSGFNKYYGEFLFFFFLFLKNKYIKHIKVFFPVLFFLFLVNVCFLLYLYYMENHEILTLTAELHSLKEKNQQLQGAIAEALKKLEAPEQEKKKSFFFS